MKLGYRASAFPIYPLAQQFAEKFHAFTRPRQQNTRVKDLADMVWYTERYPFGSSALRDSCLATFDRRSEHPWPPLIPHTPPEWNRPYATLRAELKITPAEPEQARETIVLFLQPVLVGDRGRTWDPRGRSWST